MATISGKSNREIMERLKQIPYTPGTILSEVHRDVIGRAPIRLDTSDSPGSKKRTRNPNSKKAVKGAKRTKKIEPVLQDSSANASYTKSTQQRSDYSGQESKAKPGSYDSPGKLEVTVEQSSITNFGNNDPDEVKSYAGLWWEYQGIYFLKSDEGETGFTPDEARGLAGALRPYCDESFQKSRSQNINVDYRIGDRSIKIPVHINSDGYVSKIATRDIFKLE